MISTDAPAMVVALSRALRDAGMAVTPDRSVVAADALRVLRPRTRNEVYWATRTSLVASHEQIAVFNRVFAALLDGVEDPADSRGDPNAPPPVGIEAGRRHANEPGFRELQSDGGRPPSPWAAAAASVDRGGGPARDAVLAAASAHEQLSQKSFDQLTSQELADLRRLMARLSLTPPLRRSRRVRRARHGRRLDVRTTLRRSIRTGDYPTRLAWRKRRLRPRRLVVLCDVSGSMEPYARAYLQFLQSAVGGSRAEAFVFATRLTRLTRVMRKAPSAVAIQRAAAAASDLSGGTRIAEALRTFHRVHGSRGMARDAVIVIVSDGWEVGDPAAVALEMARLKRLAYRIVWVNPHKASPHFAPLTGGMAAALPYCDAFVSGHSLSAMHEVAQAIAGSRAAAAGWRRGTP
jgi:uncharacterized protein with von Willebrand factor type A (vWA) domain